MSGPKYGDFKFSPKHGFTGSAGRVSVRPYQRARAARKAKGGAVTIAGDAGPRPGGRPRVPLDQDDK